MDITGPEARERMYSVMTLIKACDERLRKGISTGEFMTVYWPPRGQEAIAAGIAVAFRRDDRLVTTYRGLHDLLAKGVPLREVLGEMLGRQAGACRGKGGTMHVTSPEAGVMLSTGIVGAGIPVAVGLALAADPVPRFRARLLADGTLDEPRLAAIEAESERAVEEALQDVLAGPPPGLDELERDVYATNAGVPR